MLPPTRLCRSKSDQQKAQNPKSVPKANMLSPITLRASKSDRQKAKKHKSEVNASFERWLDLPSDLAANILHRIGVVGILENAHKVCTTWRKICNEPAMWKVIHMHTALGSHTMAQLRQMCKNAVDRSQGQLADISMSGFCNSELLKYIADRASHLRRLEVACCYDGMNGTWAEALKKFPALEELSLHKAGITREAIEAIGRHCPLLKVLKLNQNPPRYVNEASQNDLSIAIGTNLHELSHLELIGNSMTNTGLEVILDGCRRLASLDLRKCHYVNLKQDLGKRCSQQIKYLKLPKILLMAVHIVMKVTMTGMMMCLQTCSVIVIVGLILIMMVLNEIMMVMNDGPTLIWKYTAHDDLIKSRTCMTCWFRGHLWIICYLKMGVAVLAWTR